MNRHQFFSLIAFNILPVCMLCLFITNAFSQTKNSIKPGQLWYDTNHNIINAHGGGMLFHNGKYYWFGEHKVAGTEGNFAQVGVHCYSSADLYNWKDEGISLKVSDNSEDALAKGCIIERPKVIYNKKTKKFVMWFHYEPKGKGYKTAQSGIAVSNDITGPYTFLKSVRPDKNTWPSNVLSSHKSKPFTRHDLKFPGGSLPLHPDTLNLVGRDYEKGQMARDMNLFVDDNGKAYQIYASEENSTLHISQLSDDYLSHSGKYRRVFIGDFREAPAIFKAGKKYYMITSGCTGWNPNEASYAVADNLLGDWKTMGNPCVGEGAELTFNSQSTYILPVAGKKDAFIFMGDRWNPKNAMDGRYIWLPINFERTGPEIKWAEEWNMDVFTDK